MATNTVKSTLQIRTNLSLCDRINYLRNRSYKTDSFFETIPMKRLLVILVLAAGFSLACTDQDDDLDAVNVRIKNNSSIIFDAVIVGTAPEPHLNVTPDSYSAYFIYEEAYRYAYIEISSGEETFILQPIDFVGETPLPVGFYTYILDVTDTGEVMLEFVVD